MRILIVKTSSLGDIVQAFPALQLLRNTYPKAQIDWVVESPFAGLIEAHPEINRVIRVNTKKWRKCFWKKDVLKEIAAFRKEMKQTAYDLVIDLQGNLKSGIITFCADSSKKVGFGWKTVAEWPNYFFTHQRYNPPKGMNIREDYLFLAQSITGNYQANFQGIKLNISEDEHLQIQKVLNEKSLRGEGFKVMVCPGSNWANKQLSQETTLSFLRCLSNEMDARFAFIWGTLEEKHHCEELAKAFSGKASVVDRMGLSALQNLMAEMDVVISMDSLPLHLAATTSTPTYSIFGASLAKKYKPLGGKHAAYQGQCPYGQKFVKRCPILRTCPTGSCIKNIEGEHLFAHFLHWWSARPN